MSRFRSIQNSHDALRPFRSLSALAVLFATFGIGGVTCLGQASVEEFQTVLASRAGFTAQDFSSLERGQMVTKLLPVTDKREVAVCGVARLQAPPSVIMKAFQDSMAQRKGRSLSGIVKFSNSPTLADLQTLTLENRDIEDLKQCAVGACKLKVSAAMIERLHQEVDWTSSDYRSQATQLFRQMLLAYVRDYLTRGDAALIEYQDQSQAVRLEEEVRSLLDGALYLNEFAPDLANYLRTFPMSERPDTQNAISWTKIKFGLKPVIIITHVVTYSPHSGKGAAQVLTVSKQIYASHYFDASLGLTALVSFPTTNASPDSYLLYTNHSRADALGGTFGKAKRKLVEAEAVATLKTILQQTQVNLEVHAINQSNPQTVSATRRIGEWLFGGRRVLWWLLAVMVALALAIRFRTKTSRPRAADMQRDD